MFFVSWQDESHRIVTFQLGLLIYQCLGKYYPIIFFEYVFWGEKLTNEVLNLDADSEKSKMLSFTL